MSYPIGGLPQLQRNAGAERFLTDEMKEAANRLSYKLLALIPEGPVRTAVMEGAASRGMNVHAMNDKYKNRVLSLLMYYYTEGGQQRMNNMANGIVPAFNEILKDAVLSEDGLDRKSQLPGELEYLVPFGAYTYETSSQFIERMAPIMAKIRERINEYMDNVSRKYDAPTASAGAGAGPAAPTYSITPLTKLGERYNNSLLDFVSSFRPDLVPIYSKRVGDFSKTPLYTQLLNFLAEKYPENAEYKSETMGSFYSTIILFIDKVIDKKIPSIMTNSGIDQQLKEIFDSMAAKGGRRKPRAKRTHKRRHPHSKKRRGNRHRGTHKRRN